ncbi:MAG: glutathione S-transferase family protein [Proteobacteria bacterium]|nr:glutathione S-transferase family protein [Pseudomonadota bacterium]MDE2239456.1 glutathione S-transferase family protein [Rhodospirillales bacterium]
MSRARMARWALEETGQPYRTEIIGYGPEMKSPAYTAINPMGKVPALRHGDVVVTETAAIITYLADAFPEVQLAPPPGDPARGAYYRWLFFTAGPYEAATTMKALGFSVPPERARMCGFGASQSEVLDVLEAAITPGPYLLGGAFSAADIYVGGQLGFGLMFKSIEPRPAFQSYVARLQARPAFIRANVLDGALPG